MELSRKIISIVLLFCLITGAALIGLPQTASAASDELSPADLYEQQVNSTVGITISARITSRYGYGYTYKACGSGFIVSENGYILTNYHVVDDSDTVTVATYDNKTYDAQVVGYDESNDIAVLKIDAEGLTPVKLGDSDSLRVGDTVYAIGNPLGELTFSLTHGIVSALGRDIRTGSGKKSMSLIQTDCAINSGNSGGALFNAYGEVVGVTNAKYSASAYSGEAEIDNICFAIPINSVKRIVSGIIENGYYEKPYIGITIGPLSEETANIIGFSSGAVIQEVLEDTPAEAAGLKTHDVIVKINGKQVNDTNDVVTTVSKADPGDVLLFTVYRQGQETQIEVEVGSKTQSAMTEEEEEQPAEEEAAAPEQPNEGSGFPDWGGSSIEDFFNYYFGF